MSDTKEQERNMRPRGNQASRRVINELRERIEHLEARLAQLEKRKRVPKKDDTEG